MKRIFSSVSIEIPFSRIIRKLKNYILQNLSKVSIVIIFIVIVIYNLSFRLWEMPNRVIESDVMGYYTYLPATVIHHDLNLDFIKEDFDFYKDRIWFLKSPTGQRAIQFTCGLSLMYSPFFFGAHLLSLLIVYEANGYTEPYKIALLISSLFYVVIALLFLRKILLRYFSEVTTSLTLLTVILGTNLLYYTTREAPMSHAYSFTLFNVFLYILLTWFDKPTYRKTILIGLLTGLISLIRPTNIIIVIIFIFWGITSWRGLGKRIQYFLKMYKHLFLICILSIVVWIPQFLYWKHISGSYLYFSYGDRAMFFFNDPQIFNVLFSYRKGWLLYTPVMLLALMGIPFLRRYIKEAYWSVLIFTIVNIYIISSWWDWWYGGSFGLRTFIDSYGLLALPMAALINWLISKKLWISVSTVFVLSILIFFNNFQINQYVHGAIHFASMTKKAYWETFGKLKPTEKFYQYLEYPDYKGIQERIRKIKEERAKKK